MKLFKSMPTLYKYRNPFVAGTLAIWAIYLRLRWVAAKTAIDGDEIWQVAIMGGSFWDMVRSLPNHEHGAFLSGDYFIIYPFFKMFGDNKWGLAIPHLVITAIGLYFFYLLSKQYFRTTWAYVIAFIIFAFNVSLIEHSVEVRTYAVLPSLALMALYFSKLLVDKNVLLSIKQKFGLGVFFVLTLWFHVYGVIIIFCTMLYALLDKFRDPSFKVIFVDVVKFFSIVLVIATPFWLANVFAPQILLIDGHVNPGMSLGAHPFNERNITTFDYIPNPLSDTFQFLKSIFGNLIGYKKFYVLLPGIFIPFFFPIKNRCKLIGFLLALVALPLMLLLLSVLKNGYWFLQRQFIWVMPFFALFLAWSWDSLILFIFKRER